MKTDRKAGDFPLTVTDSISFRVSRTLRKAVRWKFSAFTLAELIVVVTILSVLSTIGFLALSQYRDDAKDATVKSNVRSVYVAIAAESAITTNSPRYYVIHDPNYALSGGVIVFDGNPVPLAGGDWDAPGTNYSAGNPDYAKLKLNKDKFKIARSGAPEFFGIPGTSAAGIADPAYLVVGSADTVVQQGGASRLRSYTQVTGLVSSSVATVSGNFPVSALSGSVAGLVRDVANPSSTGALSDGAKTGAAPGCDAVTSSGYSVPALSSGQSATVSKTTANGSLSAAFSCSFGVRTLVSETPSCDSGFVPSGLSCVADVCGSTVPAHASSTATSQSVSGTWHYAASAAQCTFACAANYSWDGSACRSACSVPVSDSYSGQTYAVTPSGALAHGASLSASGTAAFGASPANGALAAVFSYSCNDGTLLKNVTTGTGGCQANYSWNSSWSSPSCASNTQTFTCAARPANTVWNTVSSYVQTWNGSAWLPADSTTAYNATASSTSCVYACAATYGWDGSACQAAPVAPTVAGTVRCGAGSATVTATPPSGSTIDWYAAATGGGALATGTNAYSPSISSTTTYYAESRNTTTGGKSATRTAVVAQVDAPPVGGTATWATQRVCSGATMTMNLSGQSGTIDRWQYSPNGGAWVDWGYAGTTSIGWVTANSGYSNYSFRAVLKNGSCAETYSAATPNSIVDAPTVGGTMSAGPNPVNYAANTTLSLGGQTGNVVQWEYYYSSWVVWGVGTPTNYVWAAYPGYSFRALVQNGVCAPAYSTTVAVSVNPQVFTYNWIATSNFASWWGYSGSAVCRRSDGVDIKPGYGLLCGIGYTIGQVITAAGCSSMYTDNTYATVATCP